MLKHEIELLARAFDKRVRNAIFNSEIAGSLAERYPKGCCGDVSVAFGHCLEKHGYDNIIYVLDETNHAWLNVGEIVVDITCPQFDEIDDLVVAEDSFWHSQRCIKKTVPFQEYDNRSTNERLRIFLKYI
ncbi:hypothetical protein [Teredinibacter turnerae]|uniref:hypothetical protein n=1 Tax=Teredinibacter turnerae TaxID=2426 RepID=UPI0005F7DFDA|nr:hypothetical protein [Teredinibacter turnerae]